RLTARLEEVAEKRLFCALRFATRMPAAARNRCFASTYGTAEAVPLRKIMFKFEFFRSLWKSCPDTSLYPRESVCWLARDQHDTYPPHRRLYKRIRAVPAIDW